MTWIRALSLSAVLIALIGLSSCGGGGGGSGGGLSTFPASGAYGWIVKQAAGNSQLSLVHPSQPDTEYRLSQSGNAAVWDTRVVSSGTVNAGAQQVTARQSQMLVYIAGEAVHSISLQANGEAPTSRPPVSGSAEACQFLMTANDYANPLNSRLLVARRGSLGNCSSEPGNRPGELGNSELRFSARGELVASPSGTTAEAPVGVLRDTSTLAPRAWLYTDRVVLWNDGAGTTLPLSPPGTIDPHIVVASTDRSAIVRRPGGLSVLDFPSGSTVIETPLSPALTAGWIWIPIGFDTDAHYLYRTSTDVLGSDNWQILKITRSRPVASILASGTGLLTSTSMGSNLIYATAQPVGVDQPHSLFRINKAGGPSPRTVYPAGIRPSVRTGSAGVHLLELSDGTSIDPTKQFLRTRLQFIDENNNTLYTVDQAYPLSSVDADALSFGRSNNTRRFVFALSTEQSYADGMLTAYDTTTRSATELGRLPGAADFGAGSDITAAVTAVPSRSGVGFAARFSPQGGISEAGSKVFSFDLDTPNSLRYVTIVR